MFPTLIFGTFKLNSTHIASALRNGYLMLDTATGYGNAKEINEAIKSTGITPMILIKFSPDDFKNGIEEAAKKHNEDLGKIPEVVLLHSPMATFEENVDAYRKLREVYPTQTLGISNFDISRIRNLIENGCKPELISLEFSSFYQPNKLIAFCKDNGITITCYRSTCKGYIFEWRLFRDLAEEQQTSVMNVVLKWISMKGVIPIVSSTKEENMKDTLSFDKVNLKPDAIKLLNQLHIGEEKVTCMLRYCSHDE